MVLKLLLKTLILFLLAAAKKSSGSSLFSVIIIHGIVDVPYFKNDLAIIFWVLLAILSIFNLRVKVETGDGSNKALNK